MLCCVRTVLAGGGSSCGIGYIDIFPEAESVRRVCLSGLSGERCETDNEKFRASESKGIEAIGLPSVEGPSVASQIYKKRSASASERKRVDGTCEASHCRFRIEDA